MDEKKHENLGSWLRMFCPDDLCLMEEEGVDLPKEGKKPEEKEKDDGLWMEMF